LNLDYNQSIFWKITPHILKDPYYLEYGPYFRNTGVGGIVTYDSRDVPQNAYKGFYSSLMFTDYSTALGGTTSYRILDF